MKFLSIILSICLLSFKAQAQLPSERSNSMEKALAYRKDKQENSSQTILTSLPSQSKEYPGRVKEMMMMRKVQTTAPELNSLPSTRKPDLETIMRKYRKN